MDYKTIFNKRLYKPYSCAQYEPDEIRKVLVTLVKKFTENLLYYYKIIYLNQDYMNFYITVIMPSFSDLPIFCRLDFIIKNIDGYFLNIYIQKKYNFYYKIDKGAKNIYKYKNNKHIYSKSNENNMNAFINKYIYNNKYFTTKTINYNKNNNIEIITYNQKINYNLYIYYHYIFTYIDNYIYKKKESNGICHSKYIGNFLVIILFI